MSLDWNYMSDTEKMVDLLADIAESLNRIVSAVEAQPSDNHEG